MWPRELPQPSVEPGTVNALRRRTRGGKEQTTGEAAGIIVAVIALVTAGVNLVTALIRAKCEVGARKHRTAAGRHRRG